MLRKQDAFSTFFIVSVQRVYLRLSGNWAVRAILLSFITIRVGRSQTAASEAGWATNL
jgi:hypothetical protein